MSIYNMFLYWVLLMSTQNICFYIVVLLMSTNNMYPQHIFYGELEKIIITKYSYLTIPLGYPMLPGITICILCIQTDRPEQVHPMYTGLSNSIGQGQMPQHAVAFDLDLYCCLGLQGTESRSFGSPYPHKNIKISCPITHPGVAKEAFSEATAISQLATSWQPAAVAKPGNRNNFL